MDTSFFNIARRPSSFVKTKWLVARLQIKRVTARRTDSFRPFVVAYSRDEICFLLLCHTRCTANARVKLRLRPNVGEVALGARHLSLFLYRLILDSCPQNYAPFQQDVASRCYPINDRVSCGFGNTGIVHTLIQSSEFASPRPAPRRSPGESAFVRPPNTSDSLGSREPAIDRSKSFVGSASEGMRCPEDKRGRDRTSLSGRRRESGRRARLFGPDARRPCEEGGDCRQRRGPWNLEHAVS